MFKDEILAALSLQANVAQFVSFNPNGVQRRSRVSGYDNDEEFNSLLQAAEVMIKASPEKSVNVRSFEPNNPKSREFVYGLTNPDDVVANVKRLGDLGLYTIVNETVDINDGGVSGVSIGNLMEFAPGDTPRCVEKPGTLQLQTSQARWMLDTVYGFAPDLGKLDPKNRIEFSIHPIPRGVYSTHTLVWETEETDAWNGQVDTQWPNRFSQFIGDKAFGLLMAEMAGLPVPRTTVIARGLAPFAFGKDTGTHDVWIRTCPRIQTPGKFSTFKGWRDPFKLMQEEDPSGEFLASVISMAGVRSLWSGAVITQADGSPLIEGKAGYGDTFMLGEQLGHVPPDVQREVLSIYYHGVSVYGDVRMEWCYDGRQVWVMQFHRGRTQTQGNVIIPGAVCQWHPFDVTLGLDKLRDLIADVRECNQVLEAEGYPLMDGIAIVGQVGVTSHVGDVLRKARIPSVIVNDESELENLSAETKN